MPRRRVLLPWSDVLGVLHLRLKDAAAALGITTCHLKFLCRRNGLLRWPAKTVRSLNARLDKLIREAAARSARAGALPAARCRRHKTITREARKVIHDLDNIYERLRNPAPELTKLASDGTMNLIDTVGVSGGTRANN